MRSIIVSDIHSNLEAFQSVLTDQGGFDEIWSLGDSWVTDRTRWSV